MVPLALLAASACRALVGTSFAYGHNDIGPTYRTRLFGVDATFRYRPLQRAIYKRFLGRTELIWSHREQPLFSGGNQSSFGSQLATAPNAEKEITATGGTYSGNTCNPGTPNAKTAASAKRSSSRGTLSNPRSTT